MILKHPGQVKSRPRHKQGSHAICRRRNWSSFRSYDWPVHRAIRKIGRLRTDAGPRREVLRYWDGLAKSPGGKQWQASSSLHHVASLDLAIISLGRASCGDRYHRPASHVRCQNSLYGCVANRCKSVCVILAPITGSGAPIILP